MADFEEAGDDDVLRKVAKDLQAKGVTEQSIRAQMNELLAGDRADQEERLT